VDAIDFLKLDIQGFELYALQGAVDVLGRTNVVHCEVEFGQIYENQPLFSEVESLLRSRNFGLIDLVSQTKYAYEDGNERDRLVWADAVFFREDEQLAEQDFLVQAAIATWVYKKNGLARSLLRRARESELR
jgi:hypothetical protein